MNTNHERFDVIPCAIRNSGPLEDELKAAGMPYRILGLPRRSVLTGPLFIADTKRILAAVVHKADESIPQPNSWFDWKPLIQVTSESANAKHSPRYVPLVLGNSAQDGIGFPPQIIHTLCHRRWFVVF